MTSNPNHAGQSALSHPPDLPEVHQSTVMLRQDFDKLTLAAERSPYHPESWIARAKFFLGKYNELACADALKAHILCDTNIRNKLPARLQATIPALSELEIERFRQISCWILYLALRELGAVEAASKYRSRFDNNMLDAERMPEDIDMSRWSTVDNPILTRHQYPWLPADLLERKLPRGADKWLPRNNVRVDAASFASAGDTVLGVFTTIERRMGDTIFIDSVSQADLKEEHLRTDETKEMALIHNVVDYTASYALGRSDARPDLLLRAGNFAGLTTNWNNVEPDNFSFVHQIRNIALVLLEHNMLYTPSFDFWKIFHVYWKFCTNAFSQTYDDLVTKEHKEVVGIAKYYSYLNHSCEPNVIWTPDYELIGGQPTTPETKWFIKVEAMEDIGANKELFISYIREDRLALPVAGRARELRPWLGRDCRCSKCVRDLAQLTGNAEGVAFTSPFKKRGLEEVNDSDPKRRRRSN